MGIDDLLSSEDARRKAFPVTAERIFLAHAGTAPLSGAAVEAMAEFARRGSTDSQAGAWVWPEIHEAREASARLLECTANEVALIGPTTLGLNLVAAGIPWEHGDEVVYYPDDYPANVYPWRALRAHGVTPAALHPRQPGIITWDIIEAALTRRTRLVALSSCHYLSGYRVDIDTIGRRLRERGILFCVDGIQTLGAFPLSVLHVDFLSADSHKWMLGPSGAGIFYVRSDRQELLRPAMVGALNVHSPQFIAQEEIRFLDGARRYESGTLNLPGILGMLASINLLLEMGIDAIGERILELRRAFIERIRPLGYRLYVEEHDLDTPTTDAHRSGIVSLTHAVRDIKALARELAAGNVSVSVRQDRLGQDLLRVSPHFYNTHDELERVAYLMR